jgi:UDPglucose--hexose-1-phosphate uridylyltransferase
MFHRSDHVKPDGRHLWLYDDEAPPHIATSDIPVPNGGAVALASHMRWHPLLGEWVVYAAHRQDRTFLPPADSNPLAPTLDAANPTELPVGRYKVAVFENRFPSFAAEPGVPPNIAGIETRPATGRAEVVVFSQDPSLSLARLPRDHVTLVLEVWADRTRAMIEGGVRYVLPFENRGVEMGVTLHHPHSQIYGYGFLPARQARMAAALRQHAVAQGHDLVVALAQQELKLGLRTVAALNSAVAFVPPFARFPYETWVTPLRPVPDLAALSDGERHDVAAALSEALRRLDALWQRPMPYLLTVNQAPPEAEAQAGWTVRIEIWPIRRAADKLKFLAGTELGTGVFVNDISPEKAAADLRAVKP